MLGVEDIKHTMQLLPFVLTPTFLHLPTKGTPKSQHYAAKFTEMALNKWQSRGSANQLSALVVAAAQSQRYVFLKTRLSG